MASDATSGTMPPRGHESLLTDLQESLRDLAAAKRESTYAREEARASEDALERERRKTASLCAELESANRRIQEDRAGREVNTDLVKKCVRLEEREGSQHQENDRLKRELDDFRTRWALANDQRSYMEHEVTRYKAENAELRHRMADVEQTDFEITTANRRLVAENKSLTANPAGKNLAQIIAMALSLLALAVALGAKPDAQFMQRLLESLMSLLPQTH